MNSSIDDLLAACGALSDRHRVRALLALARGELCVCQIIELLGLAPSTVSRHMTILKQAGLVESRKKGRWVHYRLTKDRESPVATHLSRWAIDHLSRNPEIARDRTSLDVLMKKGLEDICRKQRGAS